MKVSRLKALSRVNTIVISRKCPLAHWMVILSIGPVVVQQQMPTSQKVQTIGPSFYMWCSLTEHLSYLLVKSEC